MRCLKAAKGNTLAEYAILFSIVALALMAMQTYMTRALQGKAKDLTDVFIGKEQTGKILKRDVGSYSNSITNTSSTVEMTGDLGGAFNAAIDQTYDVNASSISVDGASVQGYREVVPTSAGAITAPVQPTPTSEPPES
jgi:Flp pilus assembly pilin Flp